MFTFSLNIELSVSISKPAYFPSCRAEAQSSSIIKIDP